MNHLLRPFEISPRQNTKCAPLNERSQKVCRKVSMVNLKVCFRVVNPFSSKLAITFDINVLYFRGNFPCISLTFMLKDLLVPGLLGDTNVYW